MEADVLGTDVWAWKTDGKSPQYIGSSGVVDSLQQVLLLARQKRYMCVYYLLLRRHPDQAMAWADAICHQHGRNNYARILFVVTQLFGKLPMLKVW